MFERFSPEARGAVLRAGGEARGLGHGHIGTEHLLLGLIGATGTKSSEALIGAGAFLMPAREKVVEALASRSPRSTAGAGADLPYTDRAARALDRSGKLSLRLGSEQVRCEHILLSLLDVEGTAGQVLRGLGVDPQAVRHAVTSSAHRPALAETEVAAAPETAEALETAPQPMTAGGSGEAAESDTRRHRAPVCPGCGSALASSLGRLTTRLAGGSPADAVDVYYCTACGTAIGVQPG